MPRWILKGGLKLGDDVLLVPLAVDQVPDGCSRSLQNHGLGCIEMQQGNPRPGFGADLGNMTRVVPDHGKVIVRVVDTEGSSPLTDSAAVYVY